MPTVPQRYHAEKTSAAFFQKKKKLGLYPSLIYRWLLNIEHKVMPKAIKQKMEELGLSEHFKSVKLYQLKFFWATFWLYAPHDSS